tara:strand:- start:736 stop:1077 length:342 start_codon:yes stop_codon:yes gene_type:complete
MDKSVAIILIIFSTFVATFGSYYLKKGAIKFNFNILDQLSNYKLVLGVFFYVLSTVIYLSVLRQHNLSLVYPITSLQYVWISFASAKYLDEEISKYRLMGIMLIIVGVYLVTR